MDRRSRTPRRARRLILRVALCCACSLTLLGVAQAGAQTGSGGQTSQPTTTPAPGAPAATLEQCVTSVAQTERSATFAGEMTAIPGSVRMSMRIDVEERKFQEALFHTVSAPGLGVWRASDPKVKVYKYLKQVTNLSSPASYRALVRFRWLNARGHVVRRAERLTARCFQPASFAEPGPPSSDATTNAPPALPGGG